MNFERCLWGIATAALAFSGTACAQNAAGQTIWIEGESAAATTAKPHPWWYDQVKTDQLSGGKWLSHFSKEGLATAEYKIEVPQAGKYFFWLRANPVQTKLLYQMNNGEWKPIDMEVGIVDQANIAADDKPDLRFIGWKNLGQIDLPKGPLTLRFRMESATENHGAIDAFVFTTQAFAPQGINRPGQSTSAPVQAGTANTWVFDPPNDPFREDAVFDWRSLNEKVAGEKGFVKLSADGNDFVYGDGTPLRFWAVNTTLQNGSEEDLRRHARFLAKLGVNMVRMHGSIPSKEAGAKITDVDQKEIEKAWRLVEAMKQQGIYTTISPFWANGGHAGTQTSWGLAGYGDKEDVWGVMFFNDDLKDAYKQWVKVLYTTKNPRTGIALKDDPAVGLIQIKNEDSLLFWTTMVIKPEQLSILQNKFASWLVDKYGSLDKTRTAWGNVGFPRDNWGEGKPDIDVWRMTQPQQGGAAVRVRDQIQFLGELQFNFYKEIADFYRNDLGCKQLINANNWIAADNETLGDVERWTYTATDVPAVNKYFNGGPHEGKNAGWRVDPGHFFDLRPALFTPTALPIALKQIAGRPMIVTESSWVAPLPYQSEAPFLIAAYQSLSGVDAYYWFSADEPEYAKDMYFPWENFPGNQKGVWKFRLPSAIQTQFPAAALAFRRGYIKRGDVVVHEERSVENLWNRTTPLIVEGRSFDPNRQTGFAEGSAVKTEVDPLAFLVGRVEAKYGGDPKQSKVVDLSKYINTQTKTIASTTGELNWNYGTGFCTLNAPKAQGATGMLKAAGTIKLADMTIQSANDYATVMAVPLDDQPLRTSKKVLLQVGTQMNPTGWASEAGQYRSEDGKTTWRGQKIVNTGKMPWQAVNTAMTLSLQNAGISKATLLDAHGYRQAEVPVKKANGGVSLALPKNAIHIVLE
jgi:hypothetical protein